MTCAVWRIVWHARMSLWLWARARAWAAKSRYDMPGLKPRYANGRGAEAAGAAWMRRRRKKAGVMRQYMKSKRARCEVDEHVWTRLLRDKAKALRVVKPLHLTLSHTVLTSAQWGTAPDWIDPGPRGLRRAQTKIRETHGPRGSADSR